MNTQFYLVSLDGAIIGKYVADSEQDARDAGAVDLGFESEAQMNQSIRPVGRLYVAAITAKTSE